MKSNRPLAPFRWWPRSTVTVSRGAGWSSPSAATLRPLGGEAGRPPAKLGLIYGHTGLQKFINMQIKVFGRRSCSSRGATSARRARPRHLPEDRGTRRCASPPRMRPTAPLSCASQLVSTTYRRTGARPDRAAPLRALSRRTFAGVGRSAPRRGGRVSPTASGRAGGRGSSARRQHLQGMEAGLERLPDGGVGIVQALQLVQGLFWRSSSSGSPLLYSEYT